MARMLLSLILASFVLPHAQATAGEMTMWSLHSDVITGSQIAHEGGPSACMFARPEDGGLNSPAATSPYIKMTSYCAANIKTVFADGAACGRCFKISYSGSGGTDPGKAGDAIIQVVNSGDMPGAFDCQVDSFQRITGARTGKFPITYDEVPCEVAPGVGVATVIGGAGNAYYTKMVFSNMPRPAVKVAVVAPSGSRSELQMQPCCGSFEGNPGGYSGSDGVTFELTHDDGSTTTFQDCFKPWPTKEGDSCRQSGSTASAGSGSTVAAGSACTRPNGWCHPGDTYTDRTDCDGDGIPDPHCAQGSNSGYLASASGCADTWPHAICQVAGSACTRPNGWCHPGDTYTDSTDCDGDGIPDPHCAQGSNSGYLASASGCADTWPHATCQASVNAKYTREYETLGVARSVVLPRLCAAVLAFAAVSGAVVGLKRWRQANSPSLSLIPAEE